MSLNMRAVNLNLLPVLSALLEERNVTRAARRLGLTQPAVSNALAQLRGLLDDPILVRSGSRMVPTERALCLAATGQKSLEDSLATLVPQFRACYTLGLLDNPNLQGRVSILAVLGDAGRVQSATASGDIPDGRVVRCASNVIRRAVLAPPDRAPARIAVPFLASP